jgi:5-methylcytosine-specific restriction enzyme B
LSRYNPHHPNSDRTLGAAAEWRGLLEDGSILARTPVWTAAVVAELDERFNSQPDMGKGKFQAKLKRQLAEASPLVSRLAAEMLWVMNLFPSNIGPAAKQATVREA